MNFFKKKEKQKVVTRMAPSPTGHLHIGTARTTLFNYLYARKHEGSFIMRSEDTDKERSTTTFETEILEGITWLGLSWDAFYRQSERTDIYRAHLERIIAEGHAYISKEPGKQDASVTVEVVRLRNPNKVITFVDEIRGEITVDTTDLGDFVIARSITEPLYHLAAVVDDHEMGVTHVIRGEDHISNTPRQILIQEAIGAQRPIYAHLPLLLAPDRSKLSKRHGAVSLSEYQSSGYSAAAIVNYLALLGWNPGTDQELFSLNELTELFDISGVQKGGAVFDIEKLKWFNREHLKNLSEDTFLEIAQDRIPESVRAYPQYSTERLSRLLSIIRERISIPAEITEEALQGEYDFAFKAPNPPASLLKWKNDPEPRSAVSRLQKLAEIISTIDEISDPETVKARIMPYAEEVGKGEVLWPLRVALTGKERSPDPFTIIYVIGSAEAYNRVRHACDTILSA